MKTSKLLLAMAVATALAAASPSAGAHERHVNCSVSSDYSLDMHGQAFVFTHDGGHPARIALGGGHLYVDGREASLSEADRARIGDFETEMRRLLPESRQVVSEAVEIAFAALEEVARGLASDPEASLASLKQAHQRVRAEIDSRPSVLFNDDAIAGVVKPIVTEFVPQIVGGAVSMALKAAFGGEEKAQALERRMERMEHEIDARVEARADRLEPLAESMCQRMRRMDAIDNALEYRTPDGHRIEFLRSHSSD